MDQYSHSQAGVQTIPEYLFATNYPTSLQNVSGTIWLLMISQLVNSVTDDSLSRFRGESFGSEIDYQRPRTESIESEGNVVHQARAIDERLLRSTRLIAAAS
jgi:hypothetical protein